MAGSPWAGYQGGGDGSGDRSAIRRGAASRIAKLAADGGTDRVDVDQVVDKWGSEDAASRYGVPMNADADLAARLVVVDAARELVASGTAIEDVFALIRARRWA